MITELKLGNGTSVLITANIASALPASVGAAIQQAADRDASSLPIYAAAFFLTTLGVVYVQEARRAARSPPHRQPRAFRFTVHALEARQPGGWGCAPELAAVSQRQAACSGRAREPVPAGGRGWGR